MNKESKTSAFADMFGALLLKLNFAHRPQELVKHRVGLRYALTYINETVDKYNEMQGLPLNVGHLGSHLKLLSEAVTSLTTAQASLTHTFFRFISYVQKTQVSDVYRKEIVEAVALMFSLPNISAVASDVTKLFFSAELHDGRLDSVSVKDQFEASYRKYAHVPPVAGDMYLSQDEKALYHIHDTYFSLVQEKVMVLFSHYGDVEHIMRQDLDGSETDALVVRFLSRNELFCMEASLFLQTATRWKSGSEIIVRKNCEGDSDER
jgi:hypothetical protein